MLDIGDQVELEDGRHGQIKFAGHVRFAQGIWYGLGKNQKIQNNVALPVIVPNFRLRFWFFPHTL